MLYMLIKQPSKMTMGHLHVWHLMQLVVYKLQPMCLFTKKVTCSSLSSLHESIFTNINVRLRIEVIDLPRTSPLLRADSSKMYFDHDDPLQFSPPVSPLRRSFHQDDEQEKANARRFMDKFKMDRSNQLLESNR